MTRKRLAALLLTALLALSLTIPASADGIWELDNGFYQRHQEECVPHGKYYLTNSPQGYCNIRSAPNGRVICQEKNGAEVLIYQTYKNWGVLQFWPDSGPIMWGWVSMEDLAPLYDYRAFAQEYADQILPADPAVTEPLLAAYLQSGRTALVIWPYPNAREASYCYEEAPRGLQTLQMRGFGRTFTDEEGHLWAQGNQHIGGRFDNCWFLLDDLGAGDGVYLPPEGVESTVGERIVSVREVPEVTMYPAKEPTPLIENYLPAILSAAAVLLSAAALRFFYGKKRNKGGAA